MEGQGTVVGRIAPDFTLPDHLGRQVTLSKACEVGPVLLVFYPKDFSLICTQQLCSYRDNMARFHEFGVQLIGVSQNAASMHSQFARRYNFEFSLCTDLKHKVARDFDTASIFMLNRPSRACFIINTKRLILYRYVEPTALTHRSADELIGILQDMKDNRLI